MSQSISRRIFSAALAIGFATLLVKTLSMAKEMIVAMRFGVGDDMDAFVLALTIPSYLINVAAGALNVSLIPTYVAVREQEGNESAAQLLASALLVNIALLLTLSLLLTTLAAPLIHLLAGSYPAEKQILTERLFLVMVPSVLCSGVTTIVAAVLNASERFLGAALCGALVPVVTVVIIIAARPFGIEALAYGTVLGYALELLAAGWLFQRAGLSLPKKFNGIHPRLTRVGAQYLPALSGASLMCSAVVIDQAMAATLGSASNAALSYATKLVSVVISCGTAALGTAVLPYFSQMIARHEYKETGTTLRHYVVLVLCVTIPTSVGFIYYSREIAAFFFERGQFTSRDTQIVGHLQAILALQIPFHTLAILFVRLISALRLNRFMLISNVISVTANVVLNYALMLTMGIEGIALSTVAVYALAALYLGWVAFRELQRNAQRPAVPLAQAA